MRENEKKQWMNLCDRAADEQDPNRLRELLADITLSLKIKLALLNAKWRTKPDVFNGCPNRIM
jgi:hypothetical protein